MVGGFFRGMVPPVRLIASKHRRALTGAFRCAATERGAMLPVRLWCANDVRHDRAVMLDGVPVRRTARDAGDGADDRRRGQVVQNCHTRWQCAVVRRVFARYHNYGSSGGVRWFSGRGG